MNFTEAVEQFRYLECLRKAGQISPDVYRAALSCLNVVDANGAVWQMQEGTGRWFVYQGGQWEAASPEKVLTMEEAEVKLPTEIELPVVVNLPAEVELPVVRELAEKEEIPKEAFSAVLEMEAPLGSAKTVTEGQGLAAIGGGPDAE